MANATRPFADGAGLRRPDVKFPGREAQRIETRERVFNAAVREFERNGVADTDVNAVVVGAGVARGTFYFHFPTKEHVLAELTRREETKIADERIYNDDRMTTPESLDVQRLLRVMADRGVTHVTLEASSHALALDRLRACRFSATAMTNITGDHVEFHGSFDAYVEAKRSLFANLAPVAPAILNRDDSCYATIAAGLRGRVYSYGFGVDAEFRALILRTNRRSTTFELRHGQTRLGPFTVHLPGQFNVLNATAACLLASTAGLNWETIARGLAAAEGPPGRLQEVGGDAPFRVVVDYAHTPNAFRSVLSDLRDATRGRLLAVFGATGNRDRSKRPLLGQIAGQLADFFVITNEDPFGEDVDEIISEVAAGAPGEEEGRQFVIERDRMEAIRIALERARPDDTVVILGKGHERSIVVDGRREPWNDADAARSVLETLR